MKTFVVLVMLAVLAWWGWDKGWFGGTEADAPAQEGAADGKVDPAAASDSANPDPATGPARQQGAEALDDELEALHARLEGSWKALVADGKDPTTADLAPELARGYSQILPATYNRPGLKQYQLELVRERLAPLAEKIFFSPTPYLKDATGLVGRHAILAGQNLHAIGKNYGVSGEYINLLRGKAPDNDRYAAGEHVKVINAKDAGYLLHIDKSDYFLDLYIAGVFAKRFPVGIGTPETPTPTGETIIDARTPQPQWTDPKTGRVINHGEAGHIIGDYWLGFKNGSLGRDGLGLHGYTGEGQATRAQVSNGCVRLENQDMALLYNTLVPCLYDSTGAFLTRAPMKVRIVD